MKHDGSTRQEQPMRSTNQALTFHQIRPQQGFAAKFSITDSQLQVEVLSLQHFQYYACTLAIKQKSVESKQQLECIDAEIVDQAMDCRFEDVEFKNGRLAIGYCRENSRFRRKYMFGAFEQVQLHSSLFVELRQARLMRIDAILSKNKIIELQAEKKIVFKEYKKLQKRVNQETRQAQQRKQRQEWRKQWLKRAVLRVKHRSSVLLQKTGQKLMSVNADTYVFFALLALLLIILKI